jgi:hypothetical protein
MAFQIVMMARFWAPLGTQKSRLADNSGTGCLLENAVAYAVHAMCKDTLPKYSIEGIKSQLIFPDIWSANGLTVTLVRALHLFIDFGIQKELEQV